MLEVQKYKLIWD
jgi:hypothetical protein